MVITTGKPAAVRCARRPSHPNGHACRCHPSRSSGAGTRSPPKRGARAPVWRAPSSRAGVLAARARQCCTAAFPGSRGGASASFARANRGNGLRGASSVSQKQARNRRQSTQHRAIGCAKKSLRLRFSESPSNSAAIKTKKISSIEAKERKLCPFEEGQSISLLESTRRAWTRPEPQIA